MPETEDDLRPISLTNFFSKVMENFVFYWLLDYIGDKIDFRQYGGFKGNSVCHYLIELINFILAHQGSNTPTAVLACMVDFSKAFNRQDHNVLVTILSDMGVPSWLLKVVMAFLTDRKMFTRYKGQMSSDKSLPGGGPQGTLLGLLLFIVLINKAGFDNQINNAGDIITSRKKLALLNEIHMMYVDDLTNKPPEERVLPENFHARTGHEFPVNDSQIVDQLNSLHQYAEDHKMKLNLKKTKVILFNPSKTIDFVPEVNLTDQPLESVEEIKLL